MSTPQHPLFVFVTPLNDYLLTDITVGANLSDMDDLLADVDIVVKTFMRQTSLRRLVASIEKHYPGSPIHIADDSELDQDTRSYYAGLSMRGHGVITLPYNVGVSVGRNALVDSTRRPYVLILDDDFVFIESTNIEVLREVLDSDPSLGVAAGTVLDNGSDVSRYEYNVRMRSGILHYFPADGPSVSIGGHHCHSAEVVHNFALFRRTVFDTVRWDEHLKMLEHSDFFLRLKRSPWRVVHVPEVKIAHFHDSPPGYADFRFDPENRLLVEKKWKLIGSIYHTESRKRDRRTVRRIYARAALKSAHELHLASTFRILARAGAGEVRQQVQRSGY